MTAVAPTVLVVDDEKNIRRTLEMVLTGEGYRVLEAESAERALQMLGNPEQPVDLGIFDLKLPGISGLDVMKAIREMGVTTPILVITGNEAVAIAEKALQNGAYGYIPKPFTLAYIDHLIATALMAGTTPPASA